MYKNLNWNEQHERANECNEKTALPFPYNVTSLSVTTLTRTSVSSAVNCSWRAPGKSAVIIAIRHGTSAALKGNVR